jgi:hypothetical protein
MDVELVGNSYTDRNDLAAAVATLLDAAGYPSTTHALTGDGFTWADHLARVDGQAPGWAEAFDGPLDRLVLQEQSQIPGFPQDEPTWLASRDAGSALRDRAASAEVWLLTTWGRRDGDRDNPELYPDFPTMNDRLDAGYVAYRDAFAAPVFVAPAGRAFRVVFDDLAEPLAPGSAFVRLYSGDGSHPSVLGTALTACVLATSLSGVPCASLPALPGTEADAAWIQDAADRAVFGATDLVFPWTVPPPEDTGEPPPEPRRSAPEARGCVSVGHRTWAAGLSVAGCAAAQRRSRGRRPAR